MDWQWFCYEKGKVVCAWGKVDLRARLGKDDESRWMPYVSVIGLIHNDRVFSFS